MKLIQQIELKSQPALYQVVRVLYRVFVYIVKLFLLLLIFLAARYGTLQDVFRGHFG